MKKYCWGIRYLILEEGTEQGYTRSYRLANIGICLSLRKRRQEIEPFIPWTGWNEKEKRVVNIVAVSLSGNDEVHGPEVLALDHQGAPRSRQSELLHWGNMVVQYLQHKKTFAHHQTTAFKRPNAHARNMSDTSPPLHPFHTQSQLENRTSETSLHPAPSSPSPLSWP